MFPALAILLITPTVILIVGLALYFCLRLARVNMERINAFEQALGWTLSISVLLLIFLLVISSIGNALRISSSALRGESYSFYD